ncbi:MAG: hypothetical protein LBF13_07410 [Campylobacteraceae bacterium]|jgi:hypothetical protein|nr:hypothetical protein [Campylobacteraceae bacterium]
MTNKKRKLISKNENISAKEFKKTPEEPTNTDKKQLALFCAAVMLCSVGVIIYTVFIEPLF